MTILGDKISRHRKRRGMTIEALAASTSMNNFELRSLEDGWALLRNPGVSTLLRLARALGVSPLLLAAAAFEDLEAGDA